MNRMPQQGTERCWDLEECAPHTGTGGGKAGTPPERAVTLRVAGLSDACCELVTVNCSGHTPRWFWVRGMEASKQEEWGSRCLQTVLSSWWWGTRHSFQSHCRRKCSYQIISSRGTVTVDVEYMQSLSLKSRQSFSIKISIRLTDLQKYLAE